MRMYDIISKKKHGTELTTEEINFVIEKYIEGIIPDYQVSALLMAIYFNNLSKRETFDLTMAMAKSGDILDLSNIEGIKVDKHSTGGVGDKTTLILAPMVASLDIPVAKMSGRGLGHTGGTIDKLESFDGFNVVISEEKFIENVNTYKIAVVGQTANLAPADKKIYALRDVTATVDNIALIASSIMSKKIASGADGIVLDVKVGSGAFMKDIDSGFALAKEMVDIGSKAGRQTIAVISNMDQPLGVGIGNALEVIEAINTLKGNGPKDITDLCLILGAFMLKIAGKAETIEYGKKILAESLRDGSALEKFRQLVKIQGGNINQVDDIKILPTANKQIDICLGESGYIYDMDTEKIGTTAMILGAGREQKNSKIDLGVGIKIYKKIGDKIDKDTIVATLFVNDESNVKEAIDLLKDAYRVKKDYCDKQTLIKGYVTSEEVIKY